jgi:hypothetical protein
MNMKAIYMYIRLSHNYHVCVHIIHSEIYPYVVITIGLENILIIVKAVMSTPEELDVGVDYYNNLHCIVGDLGQQGFIQFGVVGVGGSFPSKTLSLPPPHAPRLCSRICRY